MREHDIALATYGFNIYIQEERTKGYICFIGIAEGENHTVIFYSFITYYKYTQGITSCEVKLGLSSSSLLSNYVMFPYDTLMNHVPGGRRRKKMHRNGGRVIKCGFRGSKRN